MQCECNDNTRPRITPGMQPKIILDLYSKPYTVSKIITHGLARAGANRYLYLVPEPHFLPGYMGYVPQYKYKVSVGPRMD